MGGEIKKIISPDGAAGDYFGYSVPISTDYIVVGAEKMRQMVIIPDQLIFFL